MKSFSAGFIVEAYEGWRLVERDNFHSRCWVMIGQAGWFSRTRMGGGKYWCRRGWWATRCLTLIPKETWWSGRDSWLTRRWLFRIWWWGVRRPSELRLLFSVVSSLTKWHVLLFLHGFYRDFYLRTLHTASATSFSLGDEVRFAAAQTLHPKMWWAFPDVFNDDRDVATLWYAEEVFLFLV